MLEDSSCSSYSSCNSCLKSTSTCLWCSSNSACLSKEESLSLCPDDSTDTCSQSYLMLILIVVICVIICACLITYYLRKFHKAEKKNREELLEEQERRALENQRKQLREWIYRNSFSEDGKKEWVCIVCSFDNHPRSLHCLMCGTSHFSSDSAKKEIKSTSKIKKQSEPNNIISKKIDISDIKTLSMSLKFDNNAEDNLADQDQADSEPEEEQNFNLIISNNPNNLQFALNLRQKSARLRKLWQKKFDQDSHRYIWKQMTNINNILIGTSLPQSVFLDSINLNSMNSLDKLPEADIENNLNLGSAIDSSSTLLPLISSSTPIKNYNFNEKNNARFGFTPRHSFDTNKSSSFDQSNSLYSPTYRSSISSYRSSISLTDSHALPRFGNPISDLLSAYNNTSTPSKILDSGSNRNSLYIQEIYVPPPDFNPENVLVYSGVLFRQSEFDDDAEKDVKKLETLKKKIRRNKRKNYNKILAKIHKQFNDADMFLQTSSFQIYFDSSNMLSWKEIKSGDFAIESNFDFSRNNIQPKVQIATFPWDKLNELTEYQMKVNNFLETYDERMANISKKKNQPKSSFLSNLFFRKNDVQDAEESNQLRNSESTRGSNNHPTSPGQEVINPLNLTPRTPLTPQLIHNLTTNNPQMCPIFKVPSSPIRETNLFEENRPENNLEEPLLSSQRIYENSKDNSITYQTMTPNLTDAVRIELLALSSYPFKSKQLWFFTATSKFLQKHYHEGFVRIEIRRKPLKAFLKDSHRAWMMMRSEDLHKWIKFQFYMEPGVDFGGVEREWFSMIVKEILKPENGLFLDSSGKFTDEDNDNNLNANYSNTEIGVYQINPNSSLYNKNHLSYYRFFGRIIGKAIMEQHSLDIKLSLPLRKLIVNQPLTFNDLQFVDEELYRNLLWMKDLEDTEENRALIESLDLDFTLTLNNQNENYTVELIPNGSNTPVTYENREEYLMLRLKYKFLTSIKDQLEYFLIGIYEIIPPELLSIFDYEELNLLLCGITTIDIEDWMSHTDYSGVYSADHHVIHWFWEVIKEMDNETKIRMLQFTTGCARLPIQGFKALQSTDGKFRKFNIQSISKEVRK